MNKTMKHLLVVAGLLALPVALGAQSWLGPFGETPHNFSLSITTGGTYQAVAVANSKATVTVENNNTNGDSCWIDVTSTVAAGNTLTTSVTSLSGTTTAQKASILLLGGGAFGRYSFTPAGTLLVTCATAGDSLYVDTQ